MMGDKWQKILDLVRKTGDRCVVVDESKGEFVVMSLADYEKMVFGKSPVKGLTEDELLDRLNQDIAVWQALQPEVEETGAENTGVKIDIEEVEDEDEERYYVESVDE